MFLSSRMLLFLYIAFPEVALYIPINTFINEVFPAPFLPNKAKISFLNRLKLILLQAILPSPYTLVTFLNIKTSFFLFLSLYISSFWKSSSSLCGLSSKIELLLLSLRTSSIIIFSVTISSFCPFSTFFVWTLTFSAFSSVGSISNSEFFLWQQSPNQ